MLAGRGKSASTSPKEWFRRRFGRLARMSPFDAALFDLDGLLIDSEPFWCIAEREVFGAIGVTLSEEECGLTAGLRTQKVVEHWLERRPWDTAEHPIEDLTARINRRVVELIGERGAPKAGVAHALDFMRARGLRLGLASSSTMPVIEAALRRLDIGSAFEVVHSADFEQRSKPAPDVYLGAARRLGVDPCRCIALEDSYPGTDAAKAAGMRCIRIPENDGPVSNADLELRSLEELDEGVWDIFLAMPSPR